MTQNVLIGKTIMAVYLAEDKLAFRFDVEGQEPIVVRCDADCCSQTWIEHVENPEVLIGAPVFSVENIDLPDEQGAHPEDAKRECVTYYGLKITTTKGTCTLDYRNESNGYYGGSLSWPGEDHYGGVYGQNNSNEKWQETAR